jgi:hypothetical protein
LLAVPDAGLAAQQFAGTLLWIPGKQTIPNEPKTSH